MTESEFQVLLERAKTVEMTAMDAEQQRRSFAYGNANIENADVTRELIDRVAEELRRDESGSLTPK